MAISSSTFRNPGSQRHRRRFSTASSQYVPLSSIIAPIPATSTRCSLRYWSLERDGRLLTSASCSTSSSLRHWQCRRSASGRAAGFGAGVVFAPTVIQQLLLIGDEFPGFFQGPIQVAIQNMVVDTLDDRPCARHGGDDITHQVEVSAVVKLRIR